VQFSFSAPKCARWSKIGAAWLHKDGKGLDVILDLIPAGQPRLVLRDWEEKPRDV
jgi:hypothetical protein